MPVGGQPNIADGGSQGVGSDVLYWRTTANTFALSDLTNSLTAAGVTDAVTHDIAGTFNGASSILYVNGASAATGTLGAAGKLNGGMTFLGNFASSTSAGLTLCEMGVISATVTSGNATSLHTNQSAAWGRY